MQWCRCKEEEEEEEDEDEGNARIEIRGTWSKILKKTSEREWTDEKWSSSLKSNRIDLDERLFFLHWTTWLERGENFFPDALFFSLFATCSSFWGLSNQFCCISIFSRSSSKIRVKTSSSLARTPSFAVIEWTAYVGAAGTKMVVVLERLVS